MADDIKRVGVLTGGGDCPGLNAVIRAVVKTAINEHDWEVWGIEDGFLGLIRNKMRLLEMQDASNILNQGGTILGTSNKANPSHFAVGLDENGHPIYEDVTNRVLEHISAHELDAIICIGGDGTMSGAANLVQRGVRCVGVPKTIDNDLVGSDVTFGFHTAVAIATDALDRIHTTAASHHRVMLVELMGRNAGWLTLYAGAASGADIILIPEIPYDIDMICEYCKARSRRGKSFTIIAVSEGAKPIGGDVVVSKVVEDSPDPIRLGGIANVLANQIEEKTGIETRATILGHVQRGGSPVPIDRILGTEFGHHAIKILHEGKFGEVVVMRGFHLNSVPILDVANKQRKVPMDDPIMQSCKSIGVSFGVRE